MSLLKLPKKVDEDDDIELDFNKELLLAGEGAGASEAPLKIEFKTFFQTLISPFFGRLNPLAEPPSELVGLTS
jgi:hypothetical protein